MPNWKKVITSGSAAELQSLFVSTNITASDALFTSSLRVTGPFTITGSINATSSHISTVDYIDFNVTSAPPVHLEGRVHWIDDTKTLQVDTDVTDFNIELGHQNVVRGRNTNSFTLTKGTIVYINGESGNRPTFATASWIGDATSAATLGFVAQNIASSQTGYVITNGLLRGINTNAFAPGTQLYLSSSGQYTSTVPISPLHEVRLGKTVTQATDGIIYVDVMNGYELGELHDVLITSASTGDLITWDSSSQVWKNTKQLTGSYGITGSLTVSSSLNIVGSQVITGSLVVSGSSTKLLTSITTKTYRLTAAAYTASAQDYRIGVQYTQTGPVQIQLPLISSVGEIEYRFKDEDGNAYTNNITLVASGSDTIDGSSTAILNRDYIAIGLYNDGVSNWYIE